jgi:hypothetical protein
MNVPITGHSGYFRVLEIDATKPRNFDELDQSFLIGVAGGIGEGPRGEGARRHPAGMGHLDRRPTRGCHAGFSSR